MLTKNHATLTVEVQAHIAADAVVQGTYWNEKKGKGCFIGCLAHSPDADLLGEKYGLPLPLVKICENIFESLSANEAKAFFAAIPEAVGRDGKDLTLIHWKFLAAELRALPVQMPEIQTVIDGMDLLANGGKWSAAAAYTADATYAAAYTAAYAACAAAYTAARAADAADAAYTAAYAARAAAYTAAYTAARAAADAAARAAAYTAARATYAARAAARAAARLRQRDTILRLISEA